MSLIEQGNLTKQKQSVCITVSIELLLKVLGINGPSDTIPSMIYHPESDTFTLKFVRVSHIPFAVYLDDKPIFSYTVAEGSPHPIDIRKTN